MAGKPYVKKHYDFNERVLFNLHLPISIDGKTLDKNVKGFINRLSAGDVSKNLVYEIELEDYPGHTVQVQHRNVIGAID